MGRLTRWKVIETEEDSDDEEDEFQWSKEYLIKEHSGGLESLKTKFLKEFSRQLHLSRRKEIFKPSDLVFEVHIETPEGSSDIRTLYSSAVFEKVGWGYGMDGTAVSSDKVVSIIFDKNCTIVKITMSFMNPLTGEVETRPCLEDKIPVHVYEGQRLDLDFLPSGSTRITPFSEGGM